MCKILIIFFTFIASGLLKSIEYTSIENAFKEVQEHTPKEYLISSVNYDNDAVNDREKRRVMLLVPVDDIDKNGNMRKNDNLEKYVTRKTKRCKSPSSLQKIRPLTNNENRPYSTFLKAPNPNTGNYQVDYDDLKPIVQFLLKNSKATRNQMLGKSLSDDNDDYEQFWQALRYEVERMSKNNEFPNKKLKDFSEKNGGKKYVCHCEAEEEEEKNEKKDSKENIKRPLLRPTNKKQTQTLWRNKFNKQNQPRTNDNKKLGMTQNSKDRILKEPLANKPVQIARIIPVYVGNSNSATNDLDNINRAPIIPPSSELPVSLKNPIVGAARNNENPIQSNSPLENDSEFHLLGKSNLLKQQVPSSQNQRSESSQVKNTFDKEDYGTNISNTGMTTENFIRVSEPTERDKNNVSFESEKSVSSNGIAESFIGGLDSTSKTLIDTKECMKLYGKEVCVLSTISPEEYTRKYESTDYSTKDYANLNTEQFLSRTATIESTENIGYFDYSTTSEEKYIKTEPNHNFAEISIPTSTYTNIQNNENNIYSTSEINISHQEESEDSRYLPNSSTQQNIQFTQQNNYSPQQYEVSTKSQDYYSSTDYLQNREEIVGITGLNNIETTFSPIFDIFDTTDIDSSYVNSENVKKPEVIEDAFNSNLRNSLKENTNSISVNDNETIFPNEILNYTENREISDKNSDPLTLHGKTNIQMENSKADNKSDTDNNEHLSTDNPEKFDEHYVGSTIDANKFVSQAQRVQPIGKSKSFTDFNEIITTPSIIDLTDEENFNSEVNSDSGLSLELTEKSVNKGTNTMNSNEFSNIDAITDPNIYLGGKNIITQPKETYLQEILTSSDYPEIIDEYVNPTTKNINSYYEEMPSESSIMYSTRVADKLGNVNEDFSKDYYVTEDDIETLIGTTEDNGYSTITGIGENVGITPEGRNDLQNDPQINVETSTNAYQSQLPFCDNYVLMNTIKQGLNSFAGEPSSPEVVGAKHDELLPEIMGIPKIERFFSIPKIRDTVVNQIKNVLRNVYKLPETHSFPQWVDKEINNNFRNLIHDVSDQDENLPPMTFEEHQFKNGKWVTNLATLAPIVGEQHDVDFHENMRNKLKQYINHPVIDLETVRNPIAQSIIAKAVKHDLQEESHENSYNIDEWTIRNNLKDIISEVESEKINNGEIPTVQISENNENIREPADEEISDTNVNLNNNEDKSENYSSPAIGSTQEMDGETEFLNEKNKDKTKITEHYEGDPSKVSNLLGKATSLKKTLGTLSTENPPTIQSSTYSTTSEMVIDRESTTQSDARNLDDEFLGDSIKNTAESNTDTSTNALHLPKSNLEHPTSDGNSKIAVAKDGLIEEPIKYYSPDDRILNYFKNHRNNETSNVGTENPVTREESIEINEETVNSYEGTTQYNREDDKNLQFSSGMENEASLRESEILSQSGRFDGENSYEEKPLTGLGNTVIPRVTAPYNERNYDNVNEDIHESRTPFESTTGGEIVSDARQTTDIGVGNFTYLGRIAVKDRKSGINEPSSLQDSDLYYIGDGVRLPLEIKKLKDGSYALSISERVCEHIMKRKCPCCVPDEGNILRARKKFMDQKSANASEESTINKGTRNQDALNTRLSRSLKENTGIGRTHNLIDDTISSMPVKTFAAKYNLTLNLNDDKSSSNEITDLNRSQIINSQKSKYNSGIVDKYLDIDEDMTIHKQEIDKERKRYSYKIREKLGPYRYQRNVLEKPKPSILIMENFLNWMKGVLLPEER